MICCIVNSLIDFAVRELTMQTGNSKTEFWSGTDYKEVQVTLSPADSGSNEMIVFVDCEKKVNKKNLHAMSVS